MRLPIMVIALISMGAVAQATTAKECLKSVDAARASLLDFKDGKSDDKNVLPTAVAASECLEKLEAKGKEAKKQDAIAAWKAFRKIREEQLVPAIKDKKKAEADKIATDNKANLDKTKNALNAIVGE